MISRTAAYHGTHGFGTALAESSAIAKGFGHLTDTVQVEHDSLADLEETLTRIGPERVAAIFLEPVVGRGVLPPAPATSRASLDCAIRTECCSSWTQ